VSSYSHLAVCSNFGIPQAEWSKSYGAVGSVGNSMIQTLDGGYIIAGDNSTGYSTIGWSYMHQPMLVKTDSSGEVQWERMYDSDSVNPNSFTFKSVVETDDLGYAVFGGYGMIEFDAEGNIDWSKVLATGVEQGIQARDKGYVLVASSQGSSGGPNIAILLKTDREGNLLWNKTFSESYATGASYGVSAHSVIETKDGGYAVTGTWEADFWFLKTDSNGNVLLNKTYNFNERLVQYQGFFLVQTNDNGYIISGYATPNRWLFRIDAQGVVKWAHQNADYGSLKSMIQTDDDDDGFVAVGGIDNEALIVRTDSSGTLLWNLTFGHTSQPVNTVSLNSIAKTDNGGYVVSGTVNDTILLAKFAPEPKSPDDNTFLSFPTVLIAALVVTAAIIGISSVLVLRKKRKWLLNALNE
jgi:hypothetical protein